MRQDELPAQFATLRSDRQNDMVLVLTDESAYELGYKLIAAQNAWPRVLGRCIQLEYARAKVDLSQPDGLARLLVVG